MTGRVMADPRRRAVGRFAVVADAERIARFRAALDLAASPPVAGATGVPLTFPVCWLAEADVRAALGTALGGTGGGLPVHLEQEIDSLVALVSGARYAMDVWLAGPDARGRARIEALVSDETGVPVARLAGTVLLAGAADPPP